MALISVSAFDIAQRFVGLKETAGVASNPIVLGMLHLDQSWPAGDEVPWCSAFVNYVAWLLRLPRSKSLAARSWLGVGKPILLTEARPGFDVVILSRGDNPTSGHVGFFAAFDSQRRTVTLLGGNQGDQVCLADFDPSRVLGVRRLLG